MRLETTPTRERLDDLVQDWNELVEDRRFDEMGRRFEQIGNLPGIRILKRDMITEDIPVTRQSPNQCLLYAVGDEYEVFARAANDGSIIPRGYYEVAAPKAGDKAIYFKQGTFPVPVHYGVFTDSKTVKSKWGNCCVFEHEPNLVPENFYGTVVRFFRDDDASDNKSIN